MTFELRRFSRADQRDPYRWRGRGRLRISLIPALGIATSLWAASASADPSIAAVAGDVANGGALTLQGSGFGTKANAAPMLWDAIDNQPAYGAADVGSEVPTGNGYPFDSSSAFHTTVFGDVNLRTPFHGRNYRNAGGGGDLDWPNGLGGSSAPASQRKLYASYWFSPEGDPEVPGHSSKFFRVWDQEGGTGTRVSWTQMHLTYNTEDVDYSGWGGTPNQWNRLEMYVDADGGVIRTWTNGKLVHDIADFVKDPASSNLGLNFYVIGWDTGGNTPPTFPTSFGEIYADVTQARVELCDTPDFASRTHCEVQIPTEWSDTAIVISVEQGSFATLDGACLFVVDDTGAVNATGSCLTADIMPTTTTTSASTGGSPGSGGGGASGSGGAPEGSSGTGGAGADENDPSDDGDGCSCQQAGAPTTKLAPFFLFAALALGTRRRRSKLSSVSIR